MVPSPPIYSPTMYTLEISKSFHLEITIFIPVLKYRLGIQVYSKDAECPVCSSPSDRMGDHALGCCKSNDRISRHNILRDVIFETAASADLGPTKEERPFLNIGAITPLGAAPAGFAQQCPRCDNSSSEVGLHKIPCTWGELSTA